MNPNPNATSIRVDAVTTTSLRHRVRACFRGAPRLSVLSRSLPTSIEDLLEWARVLTAPRPTTRPANRRRPELHQRDVARFELKLFEYMTSSASGGGLTRKWLARV